MHKAKQSIECKAHRKVYKIFKTRQVYNSIIKTEIQFKLFWLSFEASRRFLIFLSVTNHLLPLQDVCYQRNVHFANPLIYTMLKRI